MGVTGLWQILQPCARPIKIETLNRKRLAVDASIWIYQFLKAVRDKEGNALRNSHVVGFFRRICKLLFFGIKPVFVFDGGAPALKRHTITARKRRREGRREDAARTAGRLLAVQMQRRAEEDEQKRRDAAHSRAHDRDEEAPVDDQNLAYVDEMHMNPQERQQNRKFRKKDAYHLPDLDVSMADMGGPNDPRIMSLEELEAYARQFDTGEDINVYDLNKIDFDSPFFTSLPASDRYNILNAARLRSRLRMGHSKEQLDGMFPDRMAFSKFQIERVRERNELTQRLMNINDPNGELEFGINGTGRVAGEKGREYVLVKNDGVEGGWALGVISNEGQQERPIDVDKPEPVPQVKDEFDEETDFEDVPIEGLNRLPKRPRTDDGDYVTADSNHMSKQFSQRRGPRRKRQPQSTSVNSNSLFMPDNTDDEDSQDDSPSGAVEADDDLFGEEDDVDLRRAIALSLETGGDDDGGGHKSPEEQDEEKRRRTSSSKDPDDASNGSPEIRSMFDAFPQSAVKDAEPVPHGDARAIASALNRRAYDAAPESREVTSFGVAVPAAESDHDLDNDSDDDSVVDFHAALLQSRPLKRKSDAVSKADEEVSKQASSNPGPSSVSKQAGSFGPLPFQKLDLGSSILGKKKMQQRTEEAAGGFINPELEAKVVKKSEPLPPWFHGDPEEDLRRQKELEKEKEKERAQMSQNYVFDDRASGRALLKRYETNEVIDLDAEDDDFSTDDPNLKTIDLTRVEEGEPVPVQEHSPQLDTAKSSSPDPPEIVTNTQHANGVSHWSKSAPASDVMNAPGKTVVDNVPAKQNKNQTPVLEFEHSDQELEWSESEAGSPSATTNAKPELAREEESTAMADQTGLGRTSRSPSVEFEDVDMTNAPERGAAIHAADQADETVFFEADDPTLDEGVGGVDEDLDYFSDPEEEELLNRLTLEAEEHARFASTLNNKSHAQNIADYEAELKQLRNQQKKDRRDADEVTQIMVQECQQLLRLFGLPYVTAPMEAEAQCAELVQLGLVDGIVTDDSDCFLFGGTRVYKNMFNQAKFVECYLTPDMEKEFNLTRDKLISIAQLLGSDYTEGLAGVGPVTALEIISEFETLGDFKRWLEGVQLQQITKEDDQDNPFRKKFRRTATKLMLPTAFPDARVEMAYLEPDVDKDPEVFQWGVPDLDALRSFLMATIGWSQERTDEVLVPVIKDMNQRLDEGTQSNITKFFAGGVGAGAAAVVVDSFAPRKREQGSKRLGNALSKMAKRAKSSRATAAEEDHPSGSESTIQTRKKGTSVRTKSGGKKQASSKTSEPE